MEKAALIDRLPLQTWKNRQTGRQITIKDRKRLIVNQTH